MGFKDSERDFTTREVGLDYLKMALDGEDLQDLSEDYEENTLRQYIGASKT